MIKIESDPDVQPCVLSPEQDRLNDIFLEVLPVILHKLKNKLTPIIGYAQILKSRNDDGFTVERLGKIESNAGELGSWLNLLKDRFKVAPVPRRPGNINRIVNRLKPDWQKSAAEKGIDFRFVLDPGVPDMPLHPGQIDLLLRNLAANACTALSMKTSDCKEIVLSTRAGKDRVTLTMRDNGIGMEPHELDGIWAPFYAKFPGGAGLGLVICEKIIANHGGSCQVRSRFGEFSEFEISFPLLGEPPEKRTARAAKMQNDDK